MVQWLGLVTFTVVAWVQSLVRELKSHKPRGTTTTAKKFCFILNVSKGFSDSSASKESSCNAGDSDSIPGSG